MPMTEGHRYLPSVEMALSTRGGAHGHSNVFYPFLKGLEQFRRLPARQCVHPFQLFSLHQPVKCGLDKMTNFCMRSRARYRMELFAKRSIDLVEFISAVFTVGFLRQSPARASSGPTFGNFSICSVVHQRASEFKNRLKASTFCHYHRIHGNFVELGNPEFVLAGQPKRS